MGWHPQSLYGLADSPVGLAAWHDRPRPGQLRDTDRPRLRRRARGRPDARRHPRQHHPVLVDEHRRLRGAHLLGIQGQLRRRQERLRSGCREHLPRRAHPGSARSWAEEAYPNLVHFNDVDRGGHFAAWEQPELYASELRARRCSVRAASTTVESGASTRCCTSSAARVRATGRAGEARLRARLGSPPSAHDARIRTTRWPHRRPSEMHSSRWTMRRP